MQGPFDTLLIANRGEIAVRVIHAAQALGLRTVAVYGDADREALHVALADEAVHIGAEADGIPYLRIPRILAAAAQSGAQAVYPGYGFLAERADFARAVIDAGLVWVGPPPLAMTAMGEKDTAKVRAEALGVPVVPGVELRGLGESAAQAAAAELGYPLLIKAVSGGGGRGMRVVRDAAELPSALAEARHEAANAFGDDALLLERYIGWGRHIEVQVLCDAHGAAIHLYERECSVQRRHQKLVEEAPAPGLDPELRARLCDDAVRLLQAIDYVGAGTVEFLLDVAAGEAYFLEVNARIQVEHPVTEQVTGIDLVQAQLRVAMGEPLWLRQAQISVSGHALEVRLCAEDPATGHQPQAGLVRRWRAPQGVRVETALHDGAEISVYYDSLMAKLIAHGHDRATAVRRLRRALDDLDWVGPPCNRGFLAALLDHEDFRAGRLSTAFLADHDIAARRDPLPDGWLVAAALLCHAEQLRGRFRNNPWRADVTVLVRDSGDAAHVYLARDVAADGRKNSLSSIYLDVRETAAAAVSSKYLGGREEVREVPAAGLSSKYLDVRGAPAEAWRFAVDHHPDPALMRPAEPTGHARLIAQGEGWLRLEIEDHIRTYRLSSHTSSTAPTATTTISIQRPGHDTETLTEGTLLPEPTPPTTAPGAITAPSAAVIAAVHVTPGELVTTNAPLVTLEAMKMLTVLRAPRDGTVASVSCTPGASVAAGQVLVALAPLPEAPQGAAS